MSSPLFPSRLLPIVCTGISAVLGVTALVVGSPLLTRSIPVAAPAAVTATHSLRSNVSGVDMMFVSLPGIGTAVMSLGSTGKPEFCPVTLHRDQLTFAMDGHLLDLSGIRLPQGTFSHPTHLMLHLDRGASRPHLVTAAPLTPSHTSAL